MMHCIVSSTINKVDRIYATKFHFWVLWQETTLMILKEQSTQEFST